MACSDAWAQTAGALGATFMLIVVPLLIWHLRNPVRR
jgi:hypothetical protein